MPAGTVTCCRHMPSRIEDYALLGDWRTAALVSRDGSVDWLCWPRFDSGACLSALLGTSDNGRWIVSPVDADARVTRRYREGTLILETDFETMDGAVRLTDFMPLAGTGSHLVRIATGLHGSVDMRTELVLRFDYGAFVPWVTRLDDGALRAVAGPDMVSFAPTSRCEGAACEVAAISSFAKVRACASSSPMARPNVRTRSRWMRDGHFGKRKPPARVVVPLPVRGRLARARSVVAHRPQGADLCGDGCHGHGCHGSRSDHVAAGTGRRRPELGLSVLLATRCDVRSDVAHERRLHR